MCQSLKCDQSYLFDILIEENQLLGSVCSKEFMDQTELEESDINDSKVQLWGRITSLNLLCHQRRWRLPPPPPPGCRRRPACSSGIYVGHPELPAVPPSRLSPVWLLLSSPHWTAASSFYQTPGETSAQSTDAETSESLAQTSAGFWGPRLTLTGGIDSECDCLNWATVPPPLRRCPVMCHGGKCSSRLDSWEVQSVYSNFKKTHFQSLDFSRNKCEHSTFWLSIKGWKSQWLVTLLLTDAVVELSLDPHLPGSLPWIAHISLTCLCSVESGVVDAGRSCVRPVQSALCERCVTLA